MILSYKSSARNIRFGKNSNSKFTKSTNQEQYTVTGKSADNSFSRKSITATTQYILPGNIIPHSWYKRFRDKRDNPDFIAIIIAGDILAWTRNGTNPYYYKEDNNVPQLIEDSVLTSYEYFQEKFGFSKSSIRRAIVRLEEYKALERKIINTKRADGKRINKLSITMNQSFLDSCFRNPELDLRVERNSFNEKNNTYDSQQQIVTLDTSNQSVQICADHISNKNKKYKYRSTKSNFIKNNSEEKSEDNPEKNNQNSGNENKKDSGNKVKIGPQNEDQKITKKAKDLPKPKQLNDFYPLSEEDAKELTSSSGREFSLNAMNEILKSMARRLKDRFFKSKAAFLSYMSKALRYEMRDAVKVSNEGFKIKSNEEKEERQAREEEKYLEETEYNLSVSPEWHFKKKLCSVLERKQAYNLLKAYRFSQVEGDSFKMHLNEHIDISQQEREIILSQARATHERAEFGSGVNETITSLKIIMPKKKDDHLALSENGIVPEFVGIWGKIRKSLISHYRDEGEALDKNWFSKLEAEVDETKKTIKLKAPSKFFKDWIRDRYGHLLMSFASVREYTYEIY